MAVNHRKQLEKGNVRARIGGIFDVDTKRLDVAKECGKIFMIKGAILLRLLSYL